MSDGGSPLRKLTQSIYFALLAVLLGVHAMGLRAGIMSEAEEEVHGVVQQKFKNQIVANKMSC